MEPRRVLAKRSLFTNEIPNFRVLVMRSGPYNTPRDPQLGWKAHMLIGHQSDGHLEHLKCAFVPSELHLYS